MKKGRCCFATLIIIVALIGGIIAGGYFGGNYLIKRYLGAEGELFRLNINNWEELIDFLTGTKNLLSSKPEINDADKPSDQNLNAAKEELQSSIIGYDPQSGIFNADVVFKAPLKLTGGQLAALIQEQFTAQQEAQIHFEVGQVKLEVDPDTESSCVITITIKIKKENLVEPLKQQLGLVGGMIVDSLSDVYITSVNKITLDAQNPGKVKIDDTFADRDLYIGEKGSSSVVNDQILNVIVMLFGGQDKNELNNQFSNVVVDAINQIGSVSFEYDQGVSYLVFENANNNDLIYELVELAELDIDDYSELDEQDKETLTGIKTDTNNLLSVLASAALDETTTPTKTDAQSAVNAVKTEFEAFAQAYELDPETIDLTGLQTAVTNLKTLFNQ